MKHEITITPEEVQEAVAMYISNYSQTSASIRAKDVELIIEEIDAGYGMNEHKVTKFRGAKITLGEKK